MDKVHAANIKRAAYVGFGQVRIVDAAAIGTTDAKGRVVPEIERQANDSQAHSHSQRTMLQCNTTRMVASLIDSHSPCIAASERVLTSGKLHAMRMPTARHIRRVFDMATRFPRTNRATSAIDLIGHFLSAGHGMAIATW